MEWKDFNRTTEIKDFAKSCLVNVYPAVGDKCLRWCRECWTKAEDIREFYELFFSTEDRDIMMSQGYGELSKTDEWEKHDERLRKMLSMADKKIDTLSDGGSLKIGNGRMAMFIPNNCGDGITETFVFSKGNNNFSRSMFQQYIGGCEGRIDIFGYDCGRQIADTIEGQYMIYVYDNYFAFIEY